MRILHLFVISFFLIAPGTAGNWGGSIATRSAYTDFHIYYDDRDDGSSAGLQATFQDIALTGTYSFGRNAISVQIAESSDPDFDNFWGGSGNWAANGDACTPATCPQSAERSEFNLTYTRQYQNGWSAYAGFYSGSVSWKEVQGRAYRGASGNNPEVPNICGTNQNSVETTTNFENQNFGLFLGGAYSKAFTDRLYGIARLALILDGEADVSENFRCAGGVASNIGDTGTLFEGEATSIGLSLYYSLNQNSGINFAFDSKDFSYDDGTDYWSGGKARTEEYLDVMSLGYVFNF